MDKFDQAEIAALRTKLAEARELLELANPQPSLELCDRGEWWKKLNIWLAANREEKK